MAAAIIGWGHTRFGRQPEETLETLIIQAVNAAILHSGIEAKEIDEIVLGHFNAGFSAQEFTASLVLQADPALRFKPATRVENACASGSAAVFQAVRTVELKAARIVLCVGAEKMTDATGPTVGENLLRAAYLAEESGIAGGFAGVFGILAERYFQQYGDASDALAMIAAKNHKNGVANPYAQMRKDLGYAFCREESDRNPRVAGPLKRTDCSLVSDGAAAIIVADTDSVDAVRAVAFRGRAHVQDFLPMSRRDVLALEGCTKAWRQTFEAAGVELNDLSFVETHDCFTIAELLEYEAMGLTAPGDGARALREGWTTIEGRLPVNASGGLKAKGHPIGATGVSMHVLSAMQLCGDAPESMQLKNPTLGGVFNMGGAGVANFASILERIR